MVYNQRYALLLGLFKGDRFAYARALYAPSVSVSVIIKKSIEDLRCYEDLDKSYIITIGTGNEVEIKGVCVFDRAVIDGNLIELPSVIHVAEDLGQIKEFEAIIGADLIFYWGLNYNPFLGVLSSRIAKKV